MIIAHVLVGPDEPYLDFTLERVRAWADEVFCVLDPAAELKEQGKVHLHADSYWTGPPLFLLDEAAHRETAWNLMVAALNPSPEDWIVVIDADEVITMPGLVRKAAKSPEFQGKGLGFTVYNMWDGPHYRIDLRFAPVIERLMFQFKPKATFTPGQRHRAPSYAYALTPTNVPLCDIAHFGYYTDKDRERKAKRDAGRGDDVTDLATRPVLLPWKKGGLPK